MNLALNNIWRKLTSQLQNAGNKAPKTLAEYKREVMVKEGKKQFEKLKDLGLNIPVALS